MSNEQNKIKVTIRTPEGVIFDEECASVSSRNILGNFDILPFHTNFITHINDNLTIRTLDNNAKIIPVQIGVVRVKRNIMDVYIILSPILHPSDK